MPLTLGSRIEGAPCPSFHASLDGEPVIIQLDNGAISKLTARASATRMNMILEDKKDLIGDAAKRLAESGFITRNGNGVEILVTALDL